MIVIADELTSTKKRQSRMNYTKYYSKEKY